VRAAPGWSNSPHRHCRVAQATVRGSGVLKAPGRVKGSGGLKNKQEQPHSVRPGRQHPHRKVIDGLSSVRFVGSFPDADVSNGQPTRLGAHAQRSARPCPSLPRLETREGAGPVLWNLQLVRVALIPAGCRTAPTGEPDG